MSNERHIAMDIVEKLNDMAMEKEGLCHYRPYEFQSVGWQGSGVYFMGVCIWSDQDDDRPYIELEDETEERMSHEEYFIQEGKAIVKDLQLKMKAFKTIKEN